MFNPTQRNVHWECWHMQMNIIRKILLNNSIHKYIIIIYYYRIIVYNTSIHIFVYLSRWCYMFIFCTQWMIFFIVYKMWNKNHNEN